jgi:hypothetical protein
MVAGASAFDKGRIVIPQRSLSAGSNGDISVFRIATGKVSVQYSRSADFSVVRIAWWGNIPWSRCSRSGGGSSDNAWSPMRDTGLRLVAVHQAYVHSAIYISVSLCMGLAQNTQAGPDLSVALNVVVTDKSGKPVPGVEEQDFTLVDNKRPQKFISFEAVRGSNTNQVPPVEVILLIDDINTGITNVAVERQQVEKFLRRDNSVLSHPVLLAFLSDAGLKLSNPSQDGKTLTAELNANRAGLRVVTRSAGVYGAGERLQLSLNAVAQLI